MGGGVRGLGVRGTSGLGGSGVCNIGAGVVLWDDRIIILKEKIVGCTGHGGLFGKREGFFIKNDRARDYNFMCCKVKTTIFVMVRGARG